VSAFTPVTTYGCILPTPTFSGTRFDINVAVLDMCDDNNNNIAFFVIGKEDMCVKFVSGQTNYLSTIT